MAKRRGVTAFLDAFQDVGTTFFDAEVDLLVVLDEQGNISRVNPAFEHETARTESSVLRHALIDLIHEDDLAAFIHSFDQTLAVQPIRLLRRESGVVVVKLIAFRFKRTDEGLRGFLIFRKE